MQPVCSLVPIGADTWRRPFALPQREPASRIPFRGRCSRPASSISIGPSPNPLQSDAPECPACLRSPLGVFMPLRIKAFSRLSPPETHLRKPPVFPSLPVARLHLMTTAADQRSRFATSREVRCFHVPLGTKFMMLQILIPVKQNLMFSARFPQVNHL